MKYIVTKQENGTEEIFIFPDSVYHKDMAEACGHLKDRSDNGRDWIRIDREPISAGFVEAGRCVGKSESLGISSRPQDSDLLANAGGMARELAAQDSDNSNDING